MPQLTGVRHGSLRPSSSWKNLIRLLSTLVIVVALSGIATAAYAVWGLASDVKTVKLQDDEVEAVGQGTQSLDGSLTVLLVGSDTRLGQDYNDGEEGELNDVNLLMHVSADHQNVTVMSFPRDLMLPIPSCPGPNGEPEYYSAMSEQQLNSTLGYGGLPCVVETIEELTGMEIPYASLITFDGVIAMSNAIGGVDVCLTTPIVDPKTDLDLPAGDVTLVGNEALQFLRTRHGVADGSDLGRINNQQVFMSALVRQMKSADTLSDPLKVYGLASAAVKNMELSSSMATIPFMQAAAGTVKDVDLDHINFVQYPVLDHPYEQGRLRPNYELATLLMETVLSGQPFDVTGQGPVAQVEGEEQPVDDGVTEEPVPEVGDEPGEEVLAEGEGTGDVNATETPVPVDPDTPVRLPDSITGLNADQSACSGGSGE